METEYSSLISVRLCLVAQGALSKRTNSQLDYPHANVSHLEQPMNTLRYMPKTSANCPGSCMKEKSQSGLFEKV